MALHTDGEHHRVWPYLFKFYERTPSNSVLQHFKQELKFLHQTLIEKISTTITIKQYCWLEKAPSPKILDLIGFSWHTILHDPP